MKLKIYKIKVSIIIEYYYILLWDFKNIMINNKRKKNKCNNKLIHYNNKLI